jgi:hypothetical protein
VSTIVNLEGIHSTPSTRCSANPASTSAGAGATAWTTGAGATSLTPPTTSSSSSSPSSTATTSGTKFGQIASSSFYNGTTVPTYVYVYYQDGPNIMYTVYPGSRAFSTPQILPLSIVPKAGTPLAATAYDNGDGTAAVSAPSPRTFDIPSRT